MSRMGGGGGWVALTIDRCITKEVGILENLVLDTIKLQICLDVGALSLSHSIVYKIVRNIQVKDVLLSN